jgi:hypothetical protein
MEGATNAMVWSPAPILDIKPDTYSSIGLGAAIITPIPGPTAKLGLKFGWDESNTGGSEDSIEQEIESSSMDLEFTYTTSGNPDKAGPPSDTFLMPSLVFEVVEWWTVRIGSNQCEIFGSTRKTIKPRAELSAFVFTQANDIETRNIPILTEVATDVYQRLCCLGYESNLPNPEAAPTKPCDQVAGLEAGKCCTKFDRQMTCAEPKDGASQSERLAAYCTYKEGTDRTLPGWKSCFGLVDQIKNLLLQKKSEATALRGTLLVDGIDDSDPRWAEPEERWDAPIQALQNWRDTVSRNYMKLDDARAGNWDNTALEWTGLAPRHLLERAPTKLLEDPATGLQGSYTSLQEHKLEGDSNLVTLEKATTINAKKSDGSQQDPTIVAKFQTEFNAVGFDGGGATLEMSVALGGNDQSAYDRDKDPKLYEALRKYPGGLPGRLDLNAAVYSTTVVDRSSKTAGATALTVELDADVGIEVMGVKTQLVLGDKAAAVYERQTAYLETTVRDEADASDVSFSLSDPDFGDYFIVRVSHFPPTTFFPVSSAPPGQVMRVSNWQNVVIKLQTEPATTARVACHGMASGDLPVLSLPVSLAGAHF